MTTRPDFGALAGGRRAMAILRGFAPERTVELARTAWEHGIDLVEVPVQGPESERALRAAVAAGAERGKACGAGTVDTAEKVAIAVDAGAAFTVAPGLDEGVARASLDAGLPHLPGVATASEIQRALALGLGWVKAFPASVLGAEWFSAIRGPFPQVRLVATGGMTTRNAQEFWAAGADIVALGSALGDAEELARLAALLEAHPAQG
ncbi:bifunctional 4-hydroxy-2-oxoglutarate aldolase/2-dehydro-3-deoxy-phosphogluconate aldolase [Gulosibacter sp. 10]|uniref:bifunctional 4-hydroxy-2-oxoglutarate aldolase/2-dehydro-3-deoxy-phosphogluconate aldolase n=1 Tax=Gulosibacter sp. 10 TaxID=1255570 RepID=UPI00097E95AA|nr:bifunctional 4-hydroxy-2-oxoglutarate aldolase/2-dehydro-3-deoxy-phosphogluconate aldolase [Gulosibacter sp. 10]SJM47692.1 4-hydroxy-2-oxoglutarate aldolase @ 2-dehydro-3-deoxyphosphogluconate aldolase [Gulosibacter sp. 10]